MDMQTEMQPILKLVDTTRVDLGERFVLTAPLPVDLGEANAGLERALARLAAGGGKRDELTAAAAGNHWSDTTRVLAALDKLDGVGLLSRTFPLSDSATVTLEPLSPQASFDPRPELPPRPRLSRFAWIRREGERMVIECASGHARLCLEDEGALALFAALFADSGADLGDLPPTALVALHNIGALSAAHGRDEEGPSGEGAQGGADGSESWAFHDLLFHTRSRLGRHGGAHGATFRFVGQGRAPAALRPASGPLVALAEPDRAALERLSLGAVMAARRSLRHYADQPIPLATLSSFLYHTARIDGVHTYPVPAPDAEPRTDLELLRRPYPSGGALHELEHYVAVRPTGEQGGGLDPGLYRYLGERHCLERVAEYTPAVAGLFFDGCRCTGQPSPPPLLLILAARFERMAWKYDAIAYSCILKNVGVVFETAYLVATALGLGICGLGSGDADRFARASGRPYLIEGSVGEMMLGLPVAEVG